MAEITLLRHGQASFGADNYDCLSPMGHQQALWLGEFLRELDEGFDRVIIGGMVRHQQTAEGVLQGLQTQIPLEVSAGLNEYDFQGLLNPYKAMQPQQWADTGHARRDYFHNMKAALHLWSQGHIDSDGLDSWQSFSQRVMSSLQLALSGDAKRTLLVTSGGPIAVMVGHALNLSAAEVCNLTLQIKNSSMTKCLFNRVDLTLDCFNDISHLRHPDKKHGITFS